MLVYPALLIKGQTDFRDGRLANFALASFGHGTGNENDWTTNEINRLLIEKKREEGACPEERRKKRLEQRLRLVAAGQAASTTLTDTV